MLYHRSMYLGTMNSTTATLMMIPEGVAGISATLELMCRIVKEYKKSMNIRSKAIELCDGFEQKDTVSEVKALHAFVRDQIRYINDVSDVETIQTPDKTLELRAGDCDDKSTLICTLLESIGFKTRFVAIGFIWGEYSHVYAEVKLGTKWVALETTEPVELGWQPDPLAVKMRKVYHN